MSSEFISIINLQWLRQSEFAKYVSKKHILPLGLSSSYQEFESGLELALKARNASNEIVIVDDDKLVLRNYKGSYFLEVSDLGIRDEILSSLATQAYLVCFFRLQARILSITLVFTFTEDTFSQMWKSVSSDRLSQFDIPPPKYTFLGSQEPAQPIFDVLVKQDPDLFGVSALKFLHSDHILTHLFAHISSMSGKEHIQFVERIHILGEHLKTWISGRISTIPKAHSDLWGHYYGERISYLDGGVSRIMSVPGIEPTGIRVGIYSVRPGDEDATTRENWELYPYVIGDVINDKSIIDVEVFERNSKRIREAARYVLELLAALRHIKNSRSSVLFIHGPVQNSFETYNELEPYYIPGISEEFLLQNGITKAEITSKFPRIPKNSDGEPLWNSCIVVYKFLLDELFNCGTPVVGVVERAASTAFTTHLLSDLVAQDTITRSAQKRFLGHINEYELKDEFILGCVLKPGEFVSPMRVRKNFQRRAQERWKGFVATFPETVMTYIKTSDNAFPFRIEFNKELEAKELNYLMSLVYHSSLLLPNYAFPVGIDIADKFAKIPDWLSKGVSTHLAAKIFKACIDKGDLALLTQMRNLLARSPRDFFFRPTS